MVPGALIILNLFVNGQSIEDSSRAFEKLAELAFKRRGALDVPLLSRLYELIASIVTGGLYPVNNIEAVFKEVFGADRSILDCSHTTATGIKMDCRWQLFANHLFAYSLIIMPWDNGMNKLRGRMNRSVMLFDREKGECLSRRCRTIPAVKKIIANFFLSARSVSAALG